MSRRAATIVDVAKRAGVARTTASDALRGHGRVSEVTRVAVEQAAAELGYRPNSAARSLRAATTGTIGLHLPEAMTRIDYYLQTVYGALEQAGFDEVDVTVITSRRLAGDQAPPSVDGVILLDPLADDPVATRLLALDLPIVTLERALGDAATGVVSADHEGAIRALLDHLAARGSTAPAFLASPAVTDWGTRAQEVYRAWCGEHGIAPTLVERPFGSDSAAYAEAAREVLTARPETDAFLCGPDGSAIVVADVLQDAGRVVGDDVLVAAMVDSPALAYTDPPVTAVDLAPRAAGALCVQLLVQIIRGEAEPNASVPLPIEVRYRASTLGR
ncbi:LacI family DNA-binding transcriptional regulator [Agrococcus sp. ARC_14]|uniref:LacI family DNA-binding transcriptional regulator n=1 Tax=Agrococcus sp. ARC_14 TaxID=2919927 RepID=UPI001F06D822|nr:LacI family DNA-binding transcriptional regulator [Agrococcus sp. ARC_14]MCH1881802.1 LacI family transcriptional regulator [Agrococcus sp. ARC_14]